MSGGKSIRGLMAALSVTILSGCATVIPAQVARDAKSGFYDTASITYEIDAGRIGVPLSVVRIEGRLVSYDQVPVSAVADHSVGTLSIEYPHPRDREGYALARVVIESRDGLPVVGSNLVAGGLEWTERLSAVAAPWNWFAGSQPAQAAGGSAGVGTKIHEIWELDIPKSELDEVVGQLDQVGFFDSSAQNSSAVEVTARLNHSTVRKRYDPVPALDSVMQRVRGQGQLISYDRPPPLPSASVASATESKVVTPSVLALRAAMPAQDANSPAAELLAKVNPAPRAGSLTSLTTRQDSRVPAVVRLPAIDGVQRY